MLTLLAAEFYAFVTLFLGYFQTARPLGRRPIRLPEDRHLWPSVDVLIPTYDEPLHVVRTTVLGAKGMKYPADKLNVFILDDGRRDEFRAFAEEVGVGYLTRPDNAHAKAGNINHALTHTGSEFVAIFDCDHVPTEAFLLMTLGWFLHDRRLGLVQTPHHFYSPDPLERNLGQFRKVPNEGELFHRLIQDGNDLWDASFFCGSCAVLRRRTLEAIGGIAVDTVTEDAHTAIRMHRTGWRTAYLNIPLAAGLATESLSAHIGQRIRWARGMIQILRLENPLCASSLSWPQRLCYLNATTHFLFAIPRLVFLTVPLAYLFFGLVNIYGYSLAVFAYAFPHIALAHITTSRIQGRYRFSFWNEVYEAILAPYILVPTLVALVAPKFGRFNVTSKGGTIRHSYFDHRIAWPLLVLLALNVAGLWAARTRYLTDPVHHDTILMNALWTVYNIVILSVAASAAWERRQRRTDVRVDVQVPVALGAASGWAPGVSLQLSRHGVSSYLAAPVKLKRSAPVTLALEDGNAGRCEFKARLVGREGLTHHVKFDDVDLEHEQFLVRLMFSRSDRWQRWNRSRRRNRPLLSGLHLCGLAVRGLFLIVLGVCTWPVSGFVRGPRGRRGRAVAGTTVLALTLVPAEAFGQPADTLRETYLLSTLTGTSVGLVLNAVHPVQNVFVDVSVTKVVSAATLDLQYGSELDENEGALDLWLNGARVTTVRLVRGPSEHVDIPLPADLLTSENVLSLRLSASCGSCGGSDRRLLIISPSSEVRLRGARLPLANDLALLPVPFVDVASQRMATVPFGFSEPPDTQMMQAGAVLASWFGVFTDVHGVRFPISVGDIPQGNAVVFVRHGSPLESRLALGSASGPLAAVRDNPNDAYGKVLVIAGDDASQMVQAAQALATEDRGGLHRDSFRPDSRTTVPRSPYDAPRWLTTSQPSSIGTYTSADRLKINGPTSINVYFRLPPDLFVAARPSVPLLLRYEYGGVSQAKGGALHVRLNDQDIDSIHLPASTTSARGAQTVQLPTAWLRPYANTMTLTFEPGSQVATDQWPYVTIDRESSIDLRALPHSVVLPRLELFADAGYPSTMSPDLATTAIILSDRPTAAELEAVLVLAGFFGAQTGVPSTSLTIAHASRVSEFADHHLIAFGTAETQPLLRLWAYRLPVDSTSTDLRASSTTIPNDWLHPEWPFRDRDRQRLDESLAASPRFDLLLEQIVSPLADDRSVVFVVPRDQTRYPEIPDVFMPGLRQGPVYGGVAIARDGRFESFLVASTAYRSGELNPYMRAEVFLFEHYWFLPAFVLAPLLVIAAQIGRATDRVAVRRLLRKPVATWGKS